MSLFTVLAPLLMLRTNLTLATLNHCSFTSLSLPRETPPFRHHLQRIRQCGHVIKGIAWPSVAVILTVFTLATVIQSIKHCNCKIRFMLNPTTLQDHSVIESAVNAAVYQIGQAASELKFCSQPTSHATQTYWTKVQYPSDKTTVEQYVREQAIFSK